MLASASSVVLLAGMSGTGKNHIALGLIACAANRRVLYTTSAEILARFTGDVPGAPAVRESNLPDRPHQTDRKRVQDLGRPLGYIASRRGSGRVTLEGRAEPQHLDVGAGEPWGEHQIDAGEHRPGAPGSAGTRQPVSLAARLDDDLTASFAYHREVMRALIWILVAGCGFHSPAARGDIPHVPTVFDLPGMSDIVLADGTMIDTTTLTIGPASNAVIDPVGQEPGGPELMLIRALTVTIPPGAVVRASGSRPLVILADRIVIEGTLDAAGHLGKPGPNGGTLPMPSSAGSGGDGVHRDLYSDSGGGGGSYGTVAGLGGKGSSSGRSNCSPTTDGGLAGTPWGSAGLDELRGGAGGGQGGAAACLKSLPGAGGGAIQLSALSRITIEPGGILHVGGGGGGGGIKCGGDDSGGGSGGGAGGALFIDAPVIELGGTLAANGGAGGGGGDSSSGATTGMPGGDAMAAPSSAQGGAAGGSYGARGGNGATGSVQAANGADNNCDGNGGGGGGGVGRIVLRVPMPTAITGGGVASPAPTIVTY